MPIDPEIARAHSFPKPEYYKVELERRWICREVPRADILRSEEITDLYVEGSRLRLREARPTDGGPPMLRLTRKVDVDPRTRLITSIYLPESEFVILATLHGRRLQKLRHRLRSAPGVTLLVDEFRGAHAGLVMGEAEFEREELMSAFVPPPYFEREVTDDPQFTGGMLARSFDPS